MKERASHPGLSEVVMSGILVLILLSFLFFSSLTMSMNVVMFGIVLLVVIFLAYVSAIWKEDALDEREEHHRLLASRFGYLVGAGILIIAAVVQLFNHEIDAWIIYVLIGMILSKSAARLYFKKMS